MNASAAMPQYKSHKKVYALKIKAITKHPNPDTTGSTAAESYGALITPEDARFAPLEVSADYMTKHKPQVGGYYVVYEDGYQSFSPAAAFESGYTALEQLAPCSIPLENQIGTEQELALKGKTGPRVSKADIAANIVSEHYFTALQGARMAVIDYAVDTDGLIPHPLDPGLGLLTFCVLMLRNGFTVTGQSACVSPENFDAGIGKRLAREDAIRQVWPLMGYALAEKLRG